MLADHSPDVQTIQQDSSHSGRTHPERECLPGMSWLVNREMSTGERKHRECTINSMARHSRIGREFRDSFHLFFGIASNPIVISR